jgi:hypothetical protein
MPNRIPWRAGDMAEWEVVAPRTVRYEDTAATLRLRDDASRQIEERYDPIPGAKTAALEGVRIIFDRIEETLREKRSPAIPPVSPPNTKDNPDNSSRINSTGEVANSENTALQETAIEAVARIRRELGVSPSVDETVLILRQNDGVRRDLKTIAEKLVEHAMERAITDNTTDLQMAREALFRDESLKPLPKRELRETLASVTGAVLTPNRRINQTETNREREAAQASVPPAMRRLPAGTVIIRPGDRVNQEHLDQFAALGLQNNRLDAVTVSVLTLLVALLVTIATAYLRQFHRDLYDDTKRLFLLSILTVLSVTGLKIGSTLLGVSAVPGVHFGYLGMMCVSAAGMVIALLLSPRVALLIVALLSVASGLALNNELRFTVITLGSSLVGIISVSALKNRGDLMRAALIVCGANVVLNVIVGYMESDQSQEILMGGLWGIVSGVFALALFYFGVALFEKPFGITTHLRLLELTDPATPILQEFRMKVPGTYAHSLMVSNIAHAAAEAIGADALLVRVAAYYHDLGKMNRPEFFIENQSNAENIHDRLSPSLSAIILASHVKEGVEIAKELGLPPLVCQLIQEHHGTSLMKYFYHRATGGLPNPALEAQFRYAGPKPQSKESAILMLADSIEAASRTLLRPSPARIGDFVEKIIDDKREDGQLDECGLTLHDLKVIQDVIARTLCGTLHARIEYPGNPATSTNSKPTTSPLPPVTSNSLTALTLPNLSSGSPMTEDGDTANYSPRTNTTIVGTSRNDGDTSA